MPSFKPKPTKKIIVNKKDAVTLDEKHKEFMSNFMIDESITIPRLKKYKKKLKKRLEKLLSKTSTKPGYNIRWSNDELNESGIIIDTDNLGDVDDTRIKPSLSSSSLINADCGDGDYSDIMYKMLDDNEDNDYYEENEHDIETDDTQTQNMNTIVHKLKSHEQQMRMKHVESCDDKIGCGQKLYLSFLEQKDMEKTNPVDSIMELKDDIEEVTKAIRTIKSGKKRYMLDNINHIFTYFDTKKQISNHSIQKSNKPTNDKVNMFFKISNNCSNTTNQAIVEQNMESKQNIVNKYLTNIDPSFLNIETYTYSIDVCSNCNKGEMILMDDDGILLCNKCFHSVQYLIDNEKPSYKETPKEVCFYAYKKINHFKEILSQFQGKETTKMPEEVIENIKHQVKKERIELSGLTYAKTKEILKKLGYNKYYEHITFIKQKLGIQPLTMSPELEETLCNLFIDIQSPYAKCVPDYRVNFLNYYYVLYKLCELLEEVKYLQYIPLLKDKDKLIEQDTIWCEMCKMLDWEFIATAT